MFWTGLAVGIVIGIVVTLGALAYLFRDFRVFR
ncbi:hypothetical protein pEaSNUABM52_00051 [Erwinia phage pEp_SNUABM_52]|nr:hypothetical protein pEaSNUABM52_00051 [Erwinia phage pEp_SNUABM_52]